MKMEIYKKMLKLQMKKKILIDKNMKLNNLGQYFKILMKF